MKYIIVDIDGTIADRGERSPYDFDNVHQDVPKKAVVNLVKHLHATGTKVIFVTGRPYKCQKSTCAWIEMHMKLYGWHGPNYFIFMRGDDDHRPDDDLKREIYKTKIEPEFGIPDFVLDDRDKVVKMWREEGLTCLQVAYGNF